MFFNFNIMVMLVFVNTILGLYVFCSLKKFIACWTFCLNSDSVASEQDLGVCGNREVILVEAGSGYAV